MVGVHDHGGVLKPALLVKLQQLPQVFIVVVGMGAPEVVHEAPQYGMGQGIAGGMDLPASIDEFLGALGGGDGVHHYSDVSGAGVLHARRHAQAAGYQAMLLVLHRPRAHSHVAQEIRQIAVIGRVQHLVRAAEARLPEDAGMQLADGDDARQQVLALFRVGLVQHALVAHALGAGLVGVHPGYDHQTVPDLLFHLRKPVHVVQHGVLPVSGAGPDDQQQPVVPARQDVRDLPIPRRLPAPHFLPDGIVPQQFLGKRHLPHKFHLHMRFLCYDNNILSLAKASPLASVKAFISISTVRCFFSSPEMSRITRPSFIMMSRLP